jgi:hypothetical protein
LKLAEYNRLHPEKLTVVQLIKKIFTFHGDVLTTPLALKRYNLSTHSNPINTVTREITSASHSYFSAGLLRPNISLTIARSNIFMAATQRWPSRREAIFLRCFHLHGRTVSQACKDWTDTGREGGMYPNPGPEKTKRNNQNGETQSSIFPYSYNISVASLLFYLKMEKAGSSETTVNTSPVTRQKTVIFIVTTFRTSNLTGIFPSTPPRSVPEPSKPRIQCELGADGL